MTVRVRSLVFLAFLAGTLQVGRGQESPNEVPAHPSWVDAMARVHTRFHGKGGTFAHFGDSITETLAFWTPLKYERKNASPEMEALLPKG